MKIRHFLCSDCGAVGEQGPVGRKRRRCDGCERLRDRHAKPRDCAACGGSLPIGSRLTYCSGGCRPQRQERRTAAEMSGGLSPEARERQRLYWQEKNRRRRASQRGGVSEPYTLAEIAVRDAFCCGLCGESVPMAVKVPEPLAPTIDHVTPISKGGDDTRANVQLAHFVCNSRKGARELSTLSEVAGQP